MFLLLVLLASVAATSHHITTFLAFFESKMSLSRQNEKQSIYKRSHGNSWRCISLSFESRRL